MSKGHRNRTTDRLSYENNWEEIFGKSEIVPTISVEEAIEELNDNYPATLKSLGYTGTATLKSLSQHDSDGWDHEIAKRMREWAIMMDFLRTLKYEDYPVQAAKKLYNSFK